MSVDREFIRGRLERVYLTERKVGRNCIIGIYNHNNVFVPANIRHSGKNILARFDLKGDRNISFPPRANFINSRVPSGFLGIPASDYVLCGVWEPYMKKSQQAPTFEESEQYYEPGKKGWFYFLPSTRGQELDAIRVDPFKQEYDPRSIGSMINSGLPYPQHYARVILIEGRDQAEKIAEEIKREGLCPIFMEPLM